MAIHHMKKHGEPEEDCYFRGIVPSGVFPDIPRVEPSLLQYVVAKVEHPDTPNGVDISYSDRVPTVAEFTRERSNTSEIDEIGADNQAHDKGLDREKSSPNITKLRSDQGLWMVVEEQVPQFRQMIPSLSAAQTANVPPANQLVNGAQLIGHEGIKVLSANLEQPTIAAHLSDIMILLTFHLFQSPSFSIIKI